MSTKRHSFRPLLFVVPDPVPSAQRPVTGVRKRQDSHMRLSHAPLPPTPAGVLDELRGEQRAFAAELDRLEARIQNALATPPHAIAERVCRLVHVREALAAVLAAANGRLGELFATNAPLTEYLRGLHAWTNAIVRALGDLVTSSEAGSPDWALFHWRIEEASFFHFDELRPAIRRALAALESEELAALRNAAGRVFAHSDDLEASLDRRPA